MKLDLETILDIIYSVQMECINELDYDYISMCKDDLTEQDLDMLEEMIDSFCSKLEDTIKDEFKIKGADKNEK